MCENLADGTIKLF